MSYLEIKSLSAYYGKAQALSDISLSVEKGEIIAIVGANGAGKSTLLDSIMGLVRQTGQIDFDGSVISGKSTSNIVKSGIGYAPERFNLFPYMSVKDNLLVGAFTAKADTEQTFLKSIPSFHGWQSAKLRKQQPNLEENAKWCPSVARS